MNIEHYRSPDKSSHCIRYTTYEGVVCSKYYKSKDSALKSKRAVIKAVTENQHIYKAYDPPKFVGSKATLQIKSPNGAVVLSHEFRNKELADTFLNELRRWVNDNNTSES